MDRKEAINILSLRRQNAIGTLGSTPREANNTAINVLVDEIYAYEMAIEAVQEPEGKWIPVSERLPEELVAVNVTWINRCPQNYYMHIKDKPFTDTAVLYRGKWYWWDATIIDYLSEYGIRISEAIDKSIDILAWQPLPEPYRGGKD